MSLVPIDEVMHFDVVTSNPTTGAASDADSTPTYSVFEEDNDTPILSAQNFTKRTSLTGNYRGSFTVSAANGFEAGKWYNVVASATVGGVAAKAVVKHFRCCPAEYAPGIPVVDAYAVDVDADTTPGSLIVKTPDGAVTMHTKTLTTDPSAEPITKAV